MKLHIKDHIMYVESYGQFEKMEKKSKNDFLAIFGLILAFSHSSHTILMPLNTQGPSGIRMTVQNFMKIVWTLFEKFEIFMKRSGEKKTRLDKWSKIFSDS